MIYAEVTDAGNSLTIGAGLFSMVGLIMWILKSALPALLREFKDQLNKVQEDHTRELVSARAEFRQEIVAFRMDNSQTRKEFLEELSKMREAHDRLRETSEMTNEAITALTQELRSMQACHPV